MDVLTLLFHLLHLVLPAWGVAALLAPVVVGWRGLALQRAAWRRLGWVYLSLAVAGSVVLVAGLVLQGRDGRMGTYAALVLVMGSVAAGWRWRR